MDIAVDEGFRGVRRMEVVETGRRRRWSDAVKIGYVTEAFSAGNSVVSVCRRHGILPTQIYQWRAKFFPDHKNQGGQFAALVVDGSEGVSVGRGQMEIVCRGGRRVVVDRYVDVDALVRVVAGLER